MNMGVHHPYHLDLCADDEDSSQMINRPGWDAPHVRCSPRMFCAWPCLLRQVGTVLGSPYDYVVARLAYANPGSRQQSLHPQVQAPLFYPWWQQHIPQVQAPLYKNRCFSLMFLSLKLDIRGLNPQSSITLPLGVATRYLAKAKYCNGEHARIYSRTKYNREEPNILLITI